MNGSFDSSSPGPLAERSPGAGSTRPPASASRSPKASPRRTSPASGFLRPLARVSWEERLGQLQEFQDRHGHCNVPRGWRGNPSLSYWVINQRYRLRKGTLSQDRVRRLQESGLSWASATDRIESRAQAWTRMYRKLVSFKNTQGHADVGSGSSPHRKLARWLANQRYLMRAGTLPEDRRLRLEGLGMLWYVERGRSRARDQAWERMYSEAKRIQSRKDCDDALGDRPKLVRWIAYQRYRMDRHLLAEDRRRRILELGIERHPSRIREQAWHRMYSSLVEYQRSQGHCWVPRLYPDNPRLGRWVSHQRYLKRSGQLLTDRRDSLERIGFEWSATPRQYRKSALRWERMALRLLAYKTLHGHTRVPRHRPPDQELADWSARQRQSRRMGRLSSEQIARLEKIGFDWDGQRSPFSTR